MPDEKKPDDKSGSQGGNNIEAMLQMVKDRGFQTVEELLSDRDKIAEERDHFKEHNEKAQKIIQKQGSELGELRKVTGKPAPKGEGASQEQASQGESLEEVEASLTDEQRQAADEAYQRASDEEKAQFANDSEARKKLLLTAREVVKVVPKSLWDKPAKKPHVGESIDLTIRKLFEKQKKRESYSPPGAGSSGSHPKPTGEAGEEREDRFAGIRSTVGSHGVLEAVRLAREKK